MAADELSEKDRGISILLRYEGPAVDDGTMNVYDAANMTAFSDFVIVAAHKVYGEDVEVRAEVTAFQRGSFGTDLLFVVGTVAVPLFPIAQEMLSVAATITDSIDLFKFLKGEPPAKVEPRDDHSVNVTNNNGQMVIVKTRR